jgi:hypothetical protein
MGRAVHALAGVDRRLVQMLAEMRKHPGGTVLNLALLCRLPNQ